MYRYYVSVSLLQKLQAHSIAYDECGLGNEAFHWKLNYLKKFRASIVEYF